MEHNNTRVTSKQSARPDKRTMGGFLYIELTFLEMSAMIM